ncbi:MAG: 16S ribosomal RNA methyltransferase A [Saccharolobus sp.]
MSFVDRDVKPIVEIGCGKGSITKLLKPDICIELDATFMEYLRGDTNLILADARYLPILKGQIVSSLPYHITFDFFKEIIKLNYISRLLLIVQKDFLDKVVNEPTYISFLLNYYFKIEMKLIISPESFRPIPKVFSVISIFTRIREYDPYVSDLIACISRYRNKTLRRVAKLCGSNSNSQLKVRDFKPWQILELLNLMGLNYV